MSVFFASCICMITNNFFTLCQFMCSLYFDLFIMLIERFGCCSCSGNVFYVYILLFQWNSPTFFLCHLCSARVNIANKIRFTRVAMFNICLDGEKHFNLFVTCFLHSLPLSFSSRCQTGYIHHKLWMLNNCIWQAEKKTKMCVRVYNNVPTINTRAQARGWQNTIS